MRPIYFFLLILFLLSFSSLLAQEKNEPLVTGDFKELMIEQFVKQLEAQTGFHFYYDHAQFDSLQINLSVREQPLRKVLELAFSKTATHFSIDQYNNVFFIKDKIIRTDLPPGFFGKIKATNDSIINNTADIDLASNTKTVTIASLENKLYEIGIKGSETKTGNATLAGYVHDDKTGEPLSGVSIFLEEKPGIGTVTESIRFLFPYIDQRPSYIKYSKPWKKRHPASCYAVF